jgi:pimeloyl-ACP methyl ester carboxylesterase
MVAAGDACIEVLVDGDGPAVVLLPSSQRDSLHETELARMVAAAGFTLLRPQPRGMGASVGSLEGITLFDLSDDIAAVIDALGNGRAVVAGHAFGHSIARVTGLRHPNKVSGVALLAAAARQFPARLLGLLDLVADGVQPRFERLEALRAAMFAPGNDPTVWLEGWHPHLRPAYRRVGSQPPRAVWWPSVNVPVLDLQGSHDPWRPLATRDELHQQLGSIVTVAVVEDASHALLPERPQDVADAMVKWMHKLPAW